MPLEKHSKEATKPFIPEELIASCYMEECTNLEAKKEMQTKPLSILIKL